MNSIKNIEKTEDFIKCLNEIVAALIALKMKFAQLMNKNVNN